VRVAGGGIQDPFLTIEPELSGGVVGSPAKSLQTSMVCRLDMAGVYRAEMGFLPR
jgi:hypothetical protein